MLLTTNNKLTRDKNFTYRICSTGNKVRHKEDSEQMQTLKVLRAAAMPLTLYGVKETETTHPCSYL